MRIHNQILGVKGVRILDSHVSLFLEMLPSYKMIFLQRHEMTTEQYSWKRGEVGEMLFPVFKAKLKYFSWKHAPRRSFMLSLWHPWLTLKLPELIDM